MEAESRAIVRLGWWMLLIAGIGTGIAGWRGGASWALGFLVGAVASYWNFRALKRIVDHLGAPHPKGRGAWKVLLRFLLLGLGAFAILNYSKLSVTAALIGLFASAGAVMLEIVFELLRGMNERT